MTDLDNMLHTKVVTPDDDWREAVQRNGSDLEWVKTKQGQQFCWIKFEKDTPLSSEMNQWGRTVYIFAIEAFRGGTWTKTHLRVGSRTLMTDFTLSEDLADNTWILQRHKQDYWHYKARQLPYEEAYNIWMEKILPLKVIE